ncbi:MAG: hypothetical protein HHJ12_12720 [Glaciimonas sp.]|nr:hypothetical protein [Glaciimonas sp.]
MKDTKHFTTRRAFIAAAGFGGVSLYGLWAAYGAAPGPLALLGLDGARNETHAEGAAQPQVKLSEGGHGGHGVAAKGPSPEEFSRMSAEFSERFRLPDGSVYPRRLEVAPIRNNDPHAGHGTMQDMAMGSAGQGIALPAAVDSQPIEVLMTAGKWYYQPNILRLDMGQPYRFRMMALDVSHGASIQFGNGARMMRLLPGRLTETELTFQRPGRYLMYCTVYCGAAHDMMQATIEVA